MLVKRDQNVEEWHLCTEMPYLCPITLFISKAHYICSKLRYVSKFVKIRRPVFVLYITVKWFHILISIQFRYKYFADSSRYVFFVYLFQSLLHASLRDLSDIPQHDNMAAQWIPNILISILWWESYEEQEITCPPTKWTVQNSDVTDLTIMNELWGCC